VNKVEHWNLNKDLLISTLYSHSNGIYKDCSQYQRHGNWSDKWYQNPQGEFSVLWFSYTLWYVAFRKKWLQHYAGALSGYGPLKYITTSKIAIFCIFNNKTSMYQVI